jgi:hypothetical protein
MTLAQARTTTKPTQMRSFILAVVLCISVLPTFATSYTYTGKGPGGQEHDWDNPMNWSPTNGVPSDGDSVSIGGFDVTLDSDLTLASLTVNSTILSGSGSIEVTNSSSFTYTDFKLTGGIVVKAQTDIYPAGGADVETLTEGPFLNLSNITVHGNAEFQVGSGVEVQNEGTWIFTPTATLALPQNTGAVAFNNTGSLFFTNASISSPGTILSNAAGATIFAAETNLFDGILASAGTIDSTTNSVFNIQGSSVYLYTGSVFTGAGNILINCGVTVSGLAAIAGNVQFLTDGANSPTAITINGVLEISNGGVFNWYGGAFSGVGTNLTGTVAVDFGGMLNIINDANGLGLNNVLVTNNGIVNWTNSGGLLMKNSALIANNAQFYILGDSLIEPNVGDTSPVAFQNTGTVEKNLGAASASTTFKVPFYDNGRLTVFVGTLQLSAGGSIHTWFVDPAGILNMNGGTFVALPDADLTSGGPITLSGNSTQIEIPENVTMTISANFNHSGGTIFGSGALIVEGGDFPGVYQWNAGTISITNSENAVTVQAGGIMNLEGGGAKTLLYGVLVNLGVINWVNDNSIDGVNMGNNAVIDNGSAFNFQCDAYMTDTSTSTNSTPVFYNELEGTVTKSAKTGSTTIGIRFIDAGAIIAQSGTIEFYNFSDNYPEAPLAVIIMEGGKIQFDNALTLHANISGSGQIIAQKGLVLSGGELTVVVIIFQGNVTNDELFDLDSFFGIITFQSGNFSQTANGTLVVPIQSTNSSGGYGKLNAGSFGNATLGGTIKVVLTNGYAPPVGAIFPFLNSYQLFNTFSNLSLPHGLSVVYTGNTASIVVTNAVPVIIEAPQIVSGQIQYAFNTVSNRSYTVQYTSDLAMPEWAPLTNFVAPSNIIYLTFPVYTNDAGFFRVVEP